MVSGGRKLIIMPLADVDHGNINRMSLALGDGFRAEGLDVVHLDYRAGADDPGPGLDALVRSGDAAAIIAMNAVGFPMAGHDVIRAHGVKLFVYGMDHPCHLFPLLEAVPPGTLFSFPTASNVDEVRRWGRDDVGFVHVAHAAEPAAAPAWTARDLPVLLAGSLTQGPDALAAQWSSRGAEEPVLRRMAELYGEGPADTLEGLARRALADTGNADGPLAAPRALAKMLRYFDPWARARARLDTMAALADRLDGRALTVVGDWTGAGANTPANVTFAGPQAAANVLAMTRRARCVVDTMPTYIRSHERLFDAMAAGALACALGGTDFPDLDDGAVVAAATPAALAARVAEALADTGAEDRAAAAGTRFRAGHTWTHRARIIKNAVLDGIA